MMTALQFCSCRSGTLKNFLRLGNIAGVVEDFGGSNDAAPAVRAAYGRGAA